MRTLKALLMAASFVHKCCFFSDSSLVLQTCKFEHCSNQELSTNHSIEFFLSGQRVSYVCRSMSEHPVKGYSHSCRSHSVPETISNYLLTQDESGTVCNQPAEACMSRKTFCGLSYIGLLCLWLNGLSMNLSPPSAPHGRSPSS